jgi:hypothetical protein
MRAEAIAEYEKALCDAWRSPQGKLEETKETAEEDAPMRGRSDPDDPKFRAYRSKQSKRMIPVGGEGGETGHDSIDSIVERLLAEAKDTGFLPIPRLKQLEQPGEDEHDDDDLRGKRGEWDESDDDDEDQPRKRRRTEQDKRRNGATVCPTCHGTGTVGWNHHHPDEDNDEDWDWDDPEKAAAFEQAAQEYQISNAVKQMTTNTESSQRCDVPDQQTIPQMRKAHADRMAKVYDAADAELKNAWRNPQ